MTQLCPTGDNGQKYQIQCLNEDDTVQVIGWANDSGAFAKMVLLHPSMHSHKAVKRNWKCHECRKHADHLQINWGMASGQKVDILDYFCIHCGHVKLTFLGTHKECEEYWKKEWDK